MRNEHRLKTYIYTYICSLIHLKSKYYKFLMLRKNNVKLWKMKKINKSERWENWRQNVKVTIKITVEKNFNDLAIEIK